jgi:hypothetical protein
MKLAKCAGVALIMVAAATACSGTNLPACSFGYPGPIGPPIFYMVSPSPGATNVPDNLSSIAFAGFGPNDLMLTGGSQSIALKLEPAPTPTPTPEGALPQSVAALSTVLSASTTYTAKYNVTLSYSGCTSHTYTIAVGSFTTQ